MPIRYPVVGDIVWDQIDASSQASIIDELADSLVSAGWTDDARNASVTLTFTGLPSDSQTCTFDTVVYTFKTAINNANPREILIGGTAADCAQNLLDCLNDTGSGEGTTYSNTTTEHPTCTASIVGAAVTVAYDTAGGAGNVITAAEALSNATLNSTTFLGGGHWLTSAATPQGLSCKVIVREGANGASVYFASVDEVAMSSAMALVPAGGRVLEVFACAHDFFVCLAGSSATAGVCVMGGVPYVRDAHVAPRVTEVEDSGGEFLVSTSVPHGLVTGANVYISDATKDSGTAFTALNGSWTITVTGLSSYTLDGSSYASGYDASTGAAAGTGQFSRLIWAKGQLYNVDVWTFRKTLGKSTYYSNRLEFYATNGNSYTYAEAWESNQAGVLIVPMISHSTPVSVLNYGGYYDLLEARLAWSPGSGAGTKTKNGEIWRAFVVDGPTPADVVKNNFDDHNWIAYTDNCAEGCLWLATGIVS